MSFTNPQHFRDSTTATKPIDPPENVTAAPLDAKSANAEVEMDDVEDDGESDVDEEYHEEGNLPMSLWMNVMLADSIRNDQVNCIPAPVRDLYPIHSTLCAHCGFVLTDRHVLLILMPDAPTLG